MKLLVFAFFILLLFSFGCLNIYKDTINDNCYNDAKYNSSYEKIDCLGEQSRYLAAFNDKEKALDICDQIKAKFVDPKKLGFTEGSNFNIFPSHAVTMYNNCIEEVAVASCSDDSSCDSAAAICQKQIIPSVFQAIDDAFSKFPGMDSFNLMHYQGCVDNVNFKKDQIDSLPKMMENFICLMTTRGKCS
ncbi:MAG: hypothetical protein NTY68_05475 [Candidatus Micrarchaeota archaeon]|nr:hypothetical protein [Candidatus Micrarchaeota archaeon]